MKFLINLLTKKLLLILETKYKNKKKKNKRPRVSQLKNRTFIDKRPEIMNKRERFGDWEGDLIISAKNEKGVLLVLHERKARYTTIEKILSRETNIINQRIQAITDCKYSGVF